ncbi:RHS repeat-associated core domain-containing protein [Rodentibacter caecimuris]|uniref:RHS repeat-associated core domain-containing protein n=1 Tax=Rodentibacter caecimuris TaxID=1796644 RepID=UPI00256F61AA|nr:RHS repeat-associated core domain-containing protein [Pasteurella caecimuris]
MWRGRYDAWGGLHYDRHLAQQNQVHQPFRLQNQYIDQETGLHYNFLRYYEPMTGRFISQDPIGLSGGDNLYRFEGTVQNQIDPLGLFVQAIVFAPKLIALGKAALVTLGILGVGVVAEEAIKNKEEYDKEQASGKCRSSEPKCPPDVYEKLNSAVAKAKDYISSLGGCKGWMHALYARRNAAYKELKARIQRENTCWNGGDSGHKERMQNLQNQIKNCEKFIEKGFR